MSVETVFISYPLTLSLCLCVALTLFVLLLIRHCILWCGLARANGKLLKACKRQSIVGLFNRQNIHIAIELHGEEGGTVQLLLPQ